MSDEKKDRILLVDDEKHLLISLEDFLVFDNFDVTVAQSGEEALEQLKTITPDLIVLDISMPGMGGLGFLRRISSSDGKPKYPVLVLTARSAMEKFFDTIDVDGFIGKPCQEDELARKIREILSRRKAVAAKKERTTKKLLLAEDDAAVSAQISKAAAESGYDIEIVESGPEVLEKAAAEKPDVIIVKEVLPRLNGSAVAGLVAVMPSISAIPVVLYDETLSEQEEVKERYGNVKCIKKVLLSNDASAIMGAVKALE